MSKAYRRSLLTLYLPEPPVPSERGEDFRTLPQRETADEPNLNALLRDLRTRQGLVRNVLEDEEAEALPFVSSMSVADGVHSVLASMEKTLGISRSEFRAHRTVDQGFTYLRRQIESSGVFVLLLGNLGTHHTNIDVEVFRGFASADELAPFVVINDQDARTAWSFTLLHEVAHLWIGATGVSGGFSDGKVEVFCNDVASLFLLDPSELAELTTASILTADELPSAITKFARSRLVSRSLVAYRLLRSGLIQEPMWRALRDRFKQEWVDFRTKEKASSKGAPDYYVVKRHRLGRGLISVVERGLSQGRLSYTKAARIFGVAPRSVQSVLGGSSGGGA
ncbi:ImmA/IrrE family metallo-endopeptidase [Lysobacter yananisis]|jgi:Zn-dependent peptidase ImmA (M78 family)|uniref:ImmA/IrrE family metallo-endopeptidase n=1 Tax=Lysobacter yananisis TaxID=1003114 RepID=A0ABY9PAR0_9GAMM|nr:ImmA/IrrE family metallo-endopeptidase [Lysobacter yananisis]WMT04163.1 ImmA/IrrE family metallo-endopeptidase [Lysobacter yananisis]